MWLLAYKHSQYVTGHGQSKSFDLSTFRIKAAKWAMEGSLVSGILTRVRMNWGLCSEAYLVERKASTS